MNNTESASCQYSIDMQRQRYINMLERENGTLRQMNRNLVYTARDIHRENVMLKMKVGGLHLLLSPPSRKTTKTTIVPVKKRAAEIEKEIAGIKHSIELEQKMARYADRSTGRSARVINAYHEDIAALLREREELGD